MWWWRSLIWSTFTMLRTIVLCRYIISITHCSWISWSMTLFLPLFYYRLASGGVWSFLAEVINKKKPLFSDYLRANRMFYFINRPSSMNFYWLVAFFKSTCRSFYVFRIHKHLRSLRNLHISCDHYTVSKNKAYDLLLVETILPVLPSNYSELITLLNYTYKILISFLDRPIWIDFHTRISTDIQ